MNKYKLYQKDRFKLILQKKEISTEFIISKIDKNWFLKHKADFYNYSKTVAIYQGVKVPYYLIIYNINI